MNYQSNLKILKTSHQHFKLISYYITGTYIELHNEGLRYRNRRFKIDL
jgi:hypothetical protein